MSRPSEETRVLPPIQKTPELKESEITLVSEGTSFEGTLNLASVARLHCQVKGKVVGRPGSLIVLATQAMIEGNVEGDTLWIEGFVRGHVIATTKVILTESARVIGDIECPRVEIEPGAYFEGRCKMAHFSKKPTEPSPVLSTSAQSV